jgi:chromosome segregation ATPase
MSTIFQKVIEAEEKLARLEAAIEHREQVYRADNTRFAQVKNDVSVLESQHKELDEKYKKMSLDLGCIKNEIDSFEDSKRSLQKEVAELSNSQIGLRIDVDNLVARKQTLEPIVSEYEIKEKQLVESIATLSSSLELVKTGIDLKDQLYVELTDKYNILLVQYQDIERKHKEKMDILTIEEQNRRKQIDVLDINKATTDYEAKLLQLNIQFEKEKSDSLNELAEINQQKEAVLVEISNLRKAFKEEEEKHNDVLINANSELLEVRETKRTLEASMKKLQAQNIVNEIA